MISSRRTAFTLEELAALSPWQLPSMDEPPPEPMPEPAPEAEALGLPRIPTAEEIEAIQKQAHAEAAELGYQSGYQEGHQRGRAEGHEQGHAEGLTQGREQGQAEGYKQGQEEGWEAGHKAGYEAGQRVMLEAVARFQPLIDSLDQPFGLMNEQVERELVTLAIAIAKQLIRRELRTDPGEIVAVAREALSILPSSARRAALHLHPDDAELVRDALALKESAPRWKIVEDPLMTRGGCRVLTETSHIDATLEKRLMAVIAQLLGGEREGDAL